MTLLALDLMKLPNWLILTYLFVFGAFLGSFLNVCVYRFPKHEGVWNQVKAIWGRSHCPRCNAEILARDNLPILGWLMRGGKCRSCNRSISTRYPMIELCNGLLFVLVYMFELPDGLHTGWAFQCVVEEELGPQMVSAADVAWSAPVWMHVRYALHMIMIQSLLVATLIDFEFRIIPTASTDPLTVFGIIAGSCFGQAFLVPVWFERDQGAFMALMPEWLQWLDFTFDALKLANEHPHLHGFLVSATGAAVGALLIWGVRVMGTYVLRKEAMGTGDIALMAMIGAFLGWQPVVIIFFLAALCAMGNALFGMIVRRETELAYGPYISLAAVLLILFWNRIWPNSRSYFDLGSGIFVIGLFMAVMLFVSLWVMQLGKRMLGISLYEEDVESEWTQADSMLHYAGEKIDEQQGQWKRPMWEGSLSGRGLKQNDVWRNGE